jgi:fatty-acyl-CoA synthase
MLEHLRIVGPDMRDVAAGEIGEIVIQGPNVMQGYWNNPQATAETITDGGWLHTGDAAWQDGEGYVYIVDRLRDAFVSAGERVFPGQIELALLEHPAVADAGVVAVPDPEVGAAGAAFVVLEPGSATSAEELRAFLGARLRPPQVAKLVIFTHEIPRNPAGKVLRAALRERLHARQSPLDTLRQWELNGGTWRVVERSGTGAVVDLCTCTGEPMERLSSSDPALLAYLSDPGTS